MRLVRNMLLVLGLNLVFLNSVHADEIERAQLLYDNHCISCHTTDIYKLQIILIESIMEYLLFPEHL